MNSDQIFSLVRQILTFGGGFLVTKGLIDSGTMATAVGAIVTLGSIAWSVATHKTTPTV